MNIKRFNKEEDLERLEEFLRNQYLENHNMTSWLPERLHDVIFRMDAQTTDEGKEKSSDYFFLWIDNNEIVGCVLTDTDTIHIFIKNGFEAFYESMVKYAEENCRPLFGVDEDGTIDFCVILHDSFQDRIEVLKKLGYEKQEGEDFDNYVYPQESSFTIDLPEGYKLLYGDTYTNEVNKWSACNLGFHPDLEAPDYQNRMSAYNLRKNSPMYKDSFECLVIDENCKETNDVCSYCFVYVDKKSKTAFIEPVSTREKYRHKGIGTAMMHGVIQRCKELGIEKCYVNSYDWRRKFYNAAGFTTEDTIGCYRKII
jgi:N-acetylglutamate synthase-like GNAT family acetyltransferase